MAFNRKLVEYTAFFSSLASPNEAVTAATIAAAYNLAARTATPRTQFKIPAFPINLKPPTIIASGLTTSFLGSRALPFGKISQGIWIAAARQVILYWTGVVFNPAVPPSTGGPPLGLPGGVNIVTYPGNQAKLALDLRNAFLEGTAKKSSKALGRAFTNHLKTVKGQWVGSSTAGTPLTVPWNGLK